MEELIRHQLESLASQRELVFKDLYRLDENNKNFDVKANELAAIIHIIDDRIDTLLNFLVTNK